MMMERVQANQKGKNGIEQALYLFLLHHIRCSTDFQARYNNAMK